MPKYTCTICNGEVNPPAHHSCAIYFKIKIRELSERVQLIEKQMRVIEDLMKIVKDK